MPVAKDLEVYADDRPPHGFNLGIEAAGVLREADAHGSIVSISSATRAAVHRRCPRSPPWRAAPEPGAAGTGLGGERENAAGGATDGALPRARLSCRPVHGRVHTAATSARCRAARASRGPVAAVAGQATGRHPGVPRCIRRRRSRSRSAQGVQPPVYFAVGGRSNPDFFRPMAERLSAIFADFTLETFADRHHFDPPHRAEPERLADSLLALRPRPPKRPTLTGSAPSSQRSGSRTRRGLLGETTRREGCARTPSRHCRS